MPGFCNYEKYRTFVYEDIRTSVIWTGTDHDLKLANNGRRKEHQADGK